MATAATLIPVCEYLQTVYRPDCDYVDGELQERNEGERSHGYLQGIDPHIRRAWTATADGSQTRVERELIVPGTPIRIVLAPVFAELDDMLQPWTS